MGSWPPPAGSPLATLLEQVGYYGQRAREIGESELTGARELGAGAQELGGWLTPLGAAQRGLGMAEDIVDWGMTPRAPTPAAVPVKAPLAPTTPPLATGLPSARPTPEGAEGPQETIRPGSLDIALPQPPGTAGGPPIPPEEITEEVTEVPSEGYRAVRLPGGKIVFTNMPLGYEKKGGEILGQDAARQAARNIGMGAPTGPLPDPINAESRALAELVRTAAAAPGEPGQAEPWSLAPSGADAFGRPIATPGWFKGQGELTGDATRMAADLASFRNLMITPQQRHEWAVQEKQRSNFQMQLFEDALGKIGPYENAIAAAPELARKQFPGDAAAQKQFIENSTKEFRAKIDTIHKTLATIMGIRPDVLTTLLQNQGASKEQPAATLPTGQ